MGDISNAKYFTGDTTPDAVKRLSPRRVKVFFGQKTSIVCSYLNDFRVITVLADEKIVVGGELLVENWESSMIPTTTWCMARYSLRLEYILFS